MDNEENKKIEPKKVEIRVEFIKPGMVLAYPSYDHEGEQVHSGHKPFTEDDISEIVNSGIEKIYYTPVDETHKESALQNYLDSQSYKGPRTIKLETQKKAVDLMSKLVKTVKDCLLQVNSDDIHELTNAISNDIDSSESEMINLLDVINFDDYIYTHSLNVGVISMLFAKKLRLNEDLIKSIGTGGFLHDVGLTKLPQNIVHKENDLSAQEFTLLQEHSELGYKIVKDNLFIDDISRNIVLHHHERFDGSGYPSGLKGEEIKDYVWIVAIADYFDSLSTKQSYSEARDTGDALKLIYQDAHLFKVELIHKFIKEMVVLFRESNFYSADSYVLLNTNELAKVASVNDNNILRPVINIISNQAGKRLKNTISVDLNVDFSRRIVRKIG